MIISLALIFSQLPKPLQSPSLLSSAQSLSRIRFCDPMDCSTPGSPVHHQLLAPTPTQVHPVSDAVQPQPSLLHFAIVTSFCFFGLFPS